MIWMFLAGWIGRSLLRQNGTQDPLAAILANLQLLIALVFCLWMGLS